jgi:hypothetical protein
VEGTAGEAWFDHSAAAEIHMQRPSLAPRRHDPFWDLDGSAARRSRTQRRFLRFGMVILSAMLLGVLVARLPTFDPALIIGNGTLKPFLAIVLLALLASCILAAAARMTTSSTAPDEG